MNKWKSQKQTQQRHQNQVKANFARAQKKKKAAKVRKKRRKSEKMREQQTTTKELNKQK